MRLRRTSDEGLSLVEVTVAMAIVTIGLLGLLDGLAAFIHQHTYQRARTAAMRLATTSLEDARRQPPSSLTSVAGTTTDSKTLNGVNFTRVTTVQLCKAGTSCTPPTAGDGVNVIANVKVLVSWQDGGGSHKLALGSTTADSSTAQQVNGSTSGLLTNVTGATGSSVVVSSMSVSPTSTAVDSSGHPVSNITVSLQAVGLSADTTVPVTWTDDAGGHQATMTGNGATWSVSVPASSITRATSGSSTASVVFAATVPGVSVLQTATLTVLPPPAFVGSCTVIPVPIALAPLTRKTALPEVLSCTTTGLVGTDTVKATYASGSGTATLNLSSADGSTWTGTIVSGTTMASSGSSESFTFSLKRASDNATATSNLTVAMS